MKVKFIEANDNLCTIAFVFNIGMKHDIVPGMSHLAEHMSFRDSNIQYLDMLYNNTTAYTANTETTFIFYNIHPKDVIDTIAIATQNMFTNNTLDGFDKEKNVIRCEMNARLDSFSNNTFANTLFSSYNVTNTNRNYTEHLKALDSITRDELYNYTQFAYSPQNCTVYITGRMEEYIKNAVQNILNDWCINNAKILNDLNKQNKYIEDYLNLSPQEELKYSPKIYCEYVPFRNVYVDFVLNASANSNLNISTDQKAYCKIFLNSYIISNLMSTNDSVWEFLLYKVRLEDGLAYNMHTSLKNLDDFYDVLTISSFTEKTLLQPFLKSSLYAIKSVESIITRENVNHVKDLIFNYLSNKYNSCDTLSRAMLLNKYNLNENQVLDILDSITVHDVKAQYNNMINAGISYSICGDITNDEYILLATQLNQMYDDIFFNNANHI